MLQSMELQRVGLNWTELNWKLNIQKTKIMASSPITSRQIEGERVETMTEFIFLVSKITVDSNYNHKIKDVCSLEGKARQN